MSSNWVSINPFERYHTPKVVREYPKVTTVTPKKPMLSCQAWKPRSLRMPRRRSRSEITSPSCSAPAKASAWPWWPWSQRDGRNTTVATHGRNAVASTRGRNTWSQHDGLNNGRDTPVATHGRKPGSKNTGRNTWSQAVVATHRSQHRIGPHTSTGTSVAFGVSLLSLP